MFHVEYTIDDITTYWHAGGEALQARVGEVTEEGIIWIVHERVLY